LFVFWVRIPRSRRGNSLKDVFECRPFNYMVFTPLDGVRNTGCPQIRKKISPN
jgi:hypothetical protein